MDIDLDKAAKFNVSQFPIHLHVNSNTWHNLEFYIKFAPLNQY